MVPFEVPEVLCKPGDPIPWMDCVDDIKTQMTSKMTCEPKSTVSCSPQTSEVCDIGKTLLSLGKTWNVFDFRRGVASKGIKQSPQNCV